MDFEDWKTKFFYTIGTEDFDVKQGSQFIKFIDGIIENKKLPNPYQKFTDDFIDNFLPSLTLNILNLNSGHAENIQTIAAVLTSITKLFCVFIDKPRFPFFKKGAYTFQSVLASKNHSDGVNFYLYSVGKRQPYSSIDCLLRVSESYGGIR